MSVLRRSTRRDIGRERWSYLGVAVTVVLGVGLFAASYDAFLNLESSYRRTYDRLAFADLTVTGGDVEAVADAAARADGVAAVTVRRTADIPIRIGGDHVLLGRVVELPDGGEPRVNRVDMLDGALPVDAADGSVLVEQHMAGHFDLSPGDAIELRTADGWHDVDVAATVVSPEYIWPARSRQDILTSSDDFGVVFATTSAFESLDLVDAVGEVLVRLEADADAGDIITTLTNRAGSGANIQTQAEQPSNAALQEDVAGFGALSFMFPILFLGAAAMATFVLLSRLVRSQRAQIASLRANGMATRRIASHYLGQGVAVTTISGAIGVVTGVIGGRLVTGVYTAAIDVPDTVTGFHVGTVVAGLALAATAGAAAATAPAIAAARTDPAAALRGTAPAGRGGRSIVERLIPPTRRLPARWRMVLRGIGRDRRRSSSTIVGVVLALVLVLASWGMVDTVEILLDRQFTDVQRQDAEVFLDTGDAATLAAVRQVPGIARAEAVGRANVVVSSGSGRYATALLAFEPSTQMHGFGSTGPPTGGLVAGQSLATLLDVEAGDTLTVGGTVAGSSSISLPIEGFVDEPLGTLVYADPDSSEALIDATGRTSVMVQFADNVDRDEMRQAITRVQGVLAYTDSRALFDTAQSFLGLFYAFVGVMLAFGALMSFALIFAMTSANAAERSAELATMRVNGMPPGQLARMLAGENLLLTVAAIVPGLAVGVWLSAVFMDSFSSDLFDFGLQIRARTLLLAATAVVVVSLVTHWPASRMIARLDLAKVVRERSQ